MKQKHHYQQGFCETLHYNSLNKVLYESSGLGQPYKKVKMDCTACKDGKCGKALECKLLEDAPEQFEYSDWHLSELK